MDVLFQAYCELFPPSVIPPSWISILFSNEFNLSLVKLQSSIETLFYIDYQSTVYRKFDLTTWILVYLNEERSIKYLLRSYGSLSDKYCFVFV